MHLIYLSLKVFEMYEILLIFLSLYHGNVKIILFVLKPLETISSHVKLERSSTDVCVSLVSLKMYLFSKQEMTDDGSAIIYIKNISQKEAKDLRKALKKIDSVKNYLPLLNKVYTHTHTHTYLDIHV